MRESLTIFAVAVILVLSALLVGPYFIDWSGQREWLAAKLSKAAGAEIHIDGPIDVRLLPRPIFRAGNISIGSSGPHQPRFSADRLDAELSLNGLLQGAVDFVDARVASPRIELTMRRDGTLIASSIDIASPQKIQFGKLTISDGTLAVLDETGREQLVVGGIAAEGQAETLLGPLKLSGSADDAQGRATFRLITGAFANRKLRTRLVIDRKGEWSHAEAEGQIALSPQTPKGSQQTGISFSGSGNVAGALRVADATSPVPWSIAAAALTADPQNVAAPAVELRAGAEGRALVANGGILAVLGKDSTGVVKLHARQLDLDNITVPPDVAPDTPRPSAAQWLAAAKRVLEEPALPSMRLSAELGIDAITAGDLTLTDAAVRLDARPGQAPHVGIALKGPDDTHLALDGNLEPGAPPGFKGSADFATRRLATVASWLGPFWPGISDAAGNGLADRALAFKGSVDVSTIGVAARNATLNLGGTALSGTLSVTAGVPGERPRLFADVTADALNPEQWPDLGQLTALTDPLDLEIALRSDSVRLTGSDSGTFETGQASLHLTKTDKVYALDQFAVSGLQGTSVSGSATLDRNRNIHANGRAVASNPLPLATLMRQLLPGGAANAFMSRAAALAPLDVGFDADATLDDNDELSPTKLSINGTAGATRFAGSVTPELKGGSASNLDVNLTLNAPEGAKVLQQTGWHVDGQFGAFHADVRAHGDIALGLDAVITATVPNAKLAFEGRVDQENGQGRLTLDGKDAAPWLRLAGIDRTLADGAWVAGANLSWTDRTVGARKIAARLNGSAITGELDYGRPTTQESTAAAALTGTLTVDTASLASMAGLVSGQPRAREGAKPSLWSSQLFGPPPVLPAADVSLHVGGLDLWPGITARDASLRLSLRSGAMTLADMTGHALGGTLGGNLTLRRNGPGASLTGKLSLDQIGLALPSLSGRLSGTFEFAGTGSSPATLVGSLGGDGRLTLVNAVLPRLDASALLRVAASFNHDDVPAEDGPVREALGGALDHAALSLGTVSAPATIAAGTVRVGIPKTPVAGGSGTVAADAALGLEDLSLAVKTTLAATELPRDWKGDPPQVTVTWKGPLDAPVRELDAGAFVNGLAARAIAREQDRIELMKDDLRERAFFARRLKQIEAEQQAARDAAQIKKVVPQPPSRPGDIRLPKPPDVGPPAIAPVKPAQPAEGGDAISKFLNALTPSSPPKLVPTRPIELSPALRPAAQAAPAHPQQDPGTQGRY